MSAAGIEEHPLSVPARDGYALGATLYLPSGQQEFADVVIFNTGGGLAARRYAHFLRYVASEGFPTLAYDYRGVGASRPPRLRGFVAGLEDWAEVDHAGVIDFVRTTYPGARITSISHSIGCLVACTAPNASTLHQMVFIGPHTGYWGDYRMPWRWPMAITWHGIMPVVARLCGYFPGAALRLGDDFPLRFALQWAGRRKPEFAVSAENPDQAREAKLLATSRQLSVAALVLTSDDDAFASESGVRRFLFGIPDAPAVRRKMEAGRHRSSPIGHFGFFRRRNADLWSAVTRFMSQRVNPGSDAPLREDRSAPSVTASGARR